MTNTSSWRLKATDALEHAKFLAQHYSRDQSSKIGALILGPTGEPLSWGYNGFPRGVNDEVKERYERPLKYQWTEHAERNAIFNAARSGHKLLGSSIYITGLCPCPDCTRGIIQAGINQVYLEAWAFDPENERAKVWAPGWEISKEMLTEAGIRTWVITSTGTVQEQHSILV